MPNVRRDHRVGLATAGRLGCGAANQLGWHAAMFCCRVERAVAGGVGEPWAMVDCETDGQRLGACWQRIGSDCGARLGTASLVLRLWQPGWLVKKYRLACVAKSHLEKD